MNSCVGDLGVPDGLVLALEDDLAALDVKERLLSAASSRRTSCRRCVQPRVRSRVSPCQRVSV